MDTYNTNKNVKLLYPDISYKLVGIFFDIHNTIGRYARERQYGNMFEEKLKELKIKHVREFRVGSTGNIVDFSIENTILVELKTKRALMKEDYYQIQRYLQITNFRLGFLVNFSSRYLNPKRIVRIDTSAKKMFT